MQNLFFEVTTENSLKENYENIQSEVETTIGYVLEQLDKCLDYKIDGDILDTLKTGIVKSISATIKAPIKEIFLELADEQENERLEIIANRDNQDTINDAFNSAKGINLW